jgi:hypothetical protein
MFGFCVVSALKARAPPCCYYVFQGNIKYVVRVTSNSIALITSFTKIGQIFQDMK